MSLIPTSLTELSADERTLPALDEDKFGISTYRRWCKEQGRHLTSKVIKGLQQEKLDVSQCFLGPVAFLPISRALTKNKQVMCLDAQNNDLQTDGAMCIAKMLLENEKINQMDLSKNSIGTTGLKILAPALIENCHLQYLNLSNNQITDEAGKSIAQIIRVNTSIVELNLSYNKLDLVGVQYIGKALETNRTLECLDLSYNCIHSKGAVTLSQGMQVNSCLRSLNLSGNGFSYEGSLALSMMLKDNTILEELDVSRNRITWKGAELLCKGLKANKTLQRLRLSGNPLSTTGCLDILEAIGDDNCGLICLIIEDIPVIAEFELLAAAIKQKRNFTHVHGGLVTSHDVLGERKEKGIVPMQRVINYLHKEGIRPLELLRDFDKEAKLKISSAAFIDRLKKCHIQLYQFEMKQLAEMIASENSVSPENSETIDYKKLIDAIVDHQLETREEKKKDILKKQKMKAYHVKILNPPLPKDEKKTDETNTKIK